MPQPKKRLSSTRSGNRRSHLALKPKVITQCSHCHSTLLPHMACLVCGYYRDKLVLPKLKK